MLTQLRSRSADKTLLQKGFTLVELLVVIVILGILAAVVVFAVGGTEKNAKVQACISERSSLEASVEAWRSLQPNGEIGDPSLSDLKTPVGGASTALVRRDPQYWTVVTGEVKRTNTGEKGVPSADCNPNT